MKDQYNYLNISKASTNHLDSHRINIIIIAIAIGMYSILFFGLYHYLLNGIVSGLALAPALIIGWLYGKRVGLLGGLFLFMWNVLLFELAGASGLKLALLGPGLLGSLFLIGVGGVAGWASEMHHSVRHHAHALALEVAERKRIQQELQASEAYNRAIISAFPDMVFVLDRAGVFLSYQAPDATDLYVPSEQITGNSIKDVMPDEFVHNCLRYISQALETGSIQVFEYQLSMPDELQDYEARLVKINDDCVLAVVRNMTALKHAQQQQMTVAIQQERIKSLSELINNLSHDFRTPLSIINTSVYLLDRQLATKSVNKQLQKIQNQSIRLERYIEAILTLTQLDNHPTLQLTNLHISQLLQPLQMKFQPIAERQSICITFEWDDAIPLILGDYYRLSQALAHLIGNAISYNKSGGAVSVRGYVTEQRVGIEVKDTGIGIDPAHHRRIFEPFYRVDPARSSELGDMGLGLAIVQKIIQLHDGEIEVESQINEGSSFKIYLPITEKDVLSSAYNTS